MTSCPGGPSTDLGPAGARGAPNNHNTHSADSAGTPARSSDSPPAREADGRGGGEAIRGCRGVRGKIRAAVRCSNLLKGQCPFDLIRNRSKGQKIAGIPRKSGPLFDSKPTTTNNAPGPVSKQKKTDTVRSGATGTGRLCLRPESRRPLGPLQAGPIERPSFRIVPGGAAQKQRFRVDLGPLYPRPGPRGAGGRMRMLQGGGHLVSRLGDSGQHASPAQSSS